MLLIKHTGAFTPSKRELPFYFGKSWDLFLFCPRGVCKMSSLISSACPGEIIYWQNREGPCVISTQFPLQTCMWFCGLFFLLLLEVAEFELAIIPLFDRRTNPSGEKPKFIQVCNMPFLKQGTIFNWGKFTKSAKIKIVSPFCFLTLRWPLRCCSLQCQTQPSKRGGRKLHL